jgi:SAM-dependent methyltransferase
VTDETGTAAAETSAEEKIRHGSSFGAAAGAYAEYRPSYAEDAVRWALEPVWSRRPLRVVDLGAGTGKLTQTLVGLGAEVTAVEPDPDMLAELRQQMPGVGAVPGRAEQIPVPDASVDAVVAGQAMHWFDMARALPEIARVLTPGGVLAGLWNMDDDDVDWVAELTAMSKRLTTITRRRWREGQAQAGLDNLATAGAGLFEPGEVREFPNAQRHTADTLVASLATHSNVLVLEETERAAKISQLRQFLASRPETAAGEFTLPAATAVLRAQRRA